MHLILWRHADAGDPVPDSAGDLARHLSERGRRQAGRVARWLRDRLPENFLVIASPAARTRETAAALGSRTRIDARLAPGRDLADYLAVASLPHGPEPGCRHVVLVGHQPVLGRLASVLLSGVDGDLSIKKGALWWFSTRERGGRGEVVLRAAITPGLAWPGADRDA